MIKILLIDDDERDIEHIKNYITNCFNNKIDCQSIHLERVSGTTIEEVDSKTQKTKTIDVLEKHWNNVDIILIDMALMGLPDKNLASQQAINEFFSTKKRVEQLQKEEKTVMIISGKLMMHCNLELNENIREYIPIVNKPEKQEGTYLQKSLCQCVKFCSNKRKDKKCLINDCLKSVLKCYI